MDLLEQLVKDISVRPIYFVFSVIYVVLGVIFLAINVYGIYLLMKIRDLLDL